MAAFDSDHGASAIDAKFRCLGCGKVRHSSMRGADGTWAAVGLFRGHHYDCLPCVHCRKAIPGMGLVENVIHTHCAKSMYPGVSEEERLSLIKCWATMLALKQQMDDAHAQSLPPDGDAAPESPVLD
jgi:hypothetical protein